MKKSPETTRPGRHRVPPERLARILAEARQRPAFAAASTAALLWVALAVAVECSQVLRFRWVDPWPAEQPALWTPDSGHVERLEAAAARLRVCLSEKRLEREVLAVAADPSLGYQGLYWTLWVISMLPDVETRPLGADGDPGPARLLVTGIERPELERVCSAAPLRLYALDSVGRGGLEP